MKKTIFLTFDYPPIQGGIARLLHILINGTGNKETITLAPLERKKREPFRIHRTVLKRFPTIEEKKPFHKVVNFFFSFPLVFPEIINREVDKIHCCQLLRTSPFGSLAKLLLKKKFYLWVYGGETKATFSKFFFSKHLNKFILNYCDGLVSISPFVTKELLNAGIPAKKITEIILGVDLKQFSPAQKNRELVLRHKLEGKFVLLTTARLVKRKGHDTVLKLLSELKNRHNNIRYLIVGDGPYRKELERIVKELKLDDFVIFAGSQTDMAAYYNLADLFIMLNREENSSKQDSFQIEGFGLVFIEAAACGKAVIGGKSGGAVDAINDKVNGYLVDPNNLREIMDKVEELIQNTAKRKKMGTEGLLWAKKFDWGKSFEILGKLV